MKRTILFLTILTLAVHSGYGQSIGISANGASIDDSAILDVSSTDKGVLLPRMTATQKDTITQPAEGLTIFQTDEIKGYYVYQNDQWVHLGPLDMDDHINLIALDQSNTYNMNLVGVQQIIEQSGILYDTGGPTGNYSNNENKTTLIQTVNTVGIMIVIEECNLESPYDSLTIFGKTYTGSAVDSFFVPYNSVLIRFHSNNVNVDSGFKIRWRGVLPSEATNDNIKMISGWQYEPSKSAVFGGLGSCKSFTVDSIGSYSVNFGGNNLGLGFASISFGSRNTNRSGYSMVFGQYNEVDGQYSLVGGFNNAVNGGGNNFSGSDSDLDGNGNMIMAYNSNINGNYNSGTINNTDIIGNSNMVGGNLNAIAQSYNTINGFQNVVDGEYNIVNGFDNSITANENLVIGEMNTVTQSNNLVSGYGNEVSTENSLVVGIQNTVSGNLNTVSGYNNQVLGIGNLVSGQSNFTNYSNSIIGGVGNKSRSDNSLVVGYNNISKIEGSLIMGTFADTVITTSTDEVPLFAIGTGYGTIFRKNGLQFTNQGKLILGQNKGEEISLINDNEYYHSAGNQTMGGLEKSGILSSLEGDSETGGIFFNGDAVTIWSPGDGHDNDGIGTASLIIVDEDNWSDGNGNPYDNNAIEAYLDISGLWQQSDATNKEDIKDYENSLDKVLSLNAYSYQFKITDEERAKGQEQKTTLGLLAQEVNEVIPEAVTVSDYGDYFVNYSQLVPVLIESIKELKAEIEALKAK